MAGETIKSEAICLATHAWSRTSHVVEWLTPDGPATTIVKGAMRAKSAFLGQYDLNYTCEIVRYARTKNGVSALKECTPLKRRDNLREGFRRLEAASWMRTLAGELAPSGEDAKDFFELLDEGLSALEGIESVEGLLGKIIRFELDVLKLVGLKPELEADGGSFQLRGERRIPVSREVAACLRNPEGEKKLKILLESARVIGVYYTFHLDCAPEVRRMVLRMISDK